MWNDKYTCAWFEINSGGNIVIPKLAHCDSFIIRENVNTNESRL